MKTQLVETIKCHRYGQREREVGERYEAGLAYVPLLLKAKRVKLVVSEPARESKPKSMISKRQSKRRDMAAEA